MKKFLMAMTLCLMCVAAANARSMQGYTTNCMVWDEVYQDWCPIENGYGIPVSMVEDSYGNTTVYIKSRKMQYFRLRNMSDEHWNASGHLQFTAQATDEDGHYCNIRFVYRNDIEAPLQMYIYYDNISYVYNIVLRNNGANI